MESYRTAAVIREFEAFCDDVSNWYIRINRKRFWKSTDKKDQMNAYWCLYGAIKATLGIMAPIIPFVTEHIYLNTVKEVEPDAPISVHLTKYPEPLKIPEFGKILEETDAARKIIAAVQRMRNEAQIKVKQPLSALYVSATDEEKALILPLADVIKEELNVKEIIFADESEFNESYFTVNFRVAGAKLKGEAQKLKGLVDALDSEGMAKLREGYNANSVNIGQFNGLESSLFDKHERPKKGFSVDKEGGFTLALDKRLTKELVCEGFVRELIRKIQVMRKDAGFAVEQRIKAAIICKDAEGTEAINQYAEKIKADILCTELNEKIKGCTEEECSIGGHELKIKLELA